MTRLLLDNSLDENGASWLFEAPLRLIRADSTADVPHALEEIEKEQTAENYIAGFFAYELGLVLEPRLATRLPAKNDVPLILCGVFKKATRLGKPEAARWIEENVRGDYAATPPQSRWDEAQYRKAFARVKEYIAAGDIYQLNLTFKADFGFYGDALAFYRDLRARQPVSYGAYMEFPDFKVLSLSPELFLRHKNGEVETKPMKGTAARGATTHEDAQIATALALDEKSRAENLMIVDLMRHDLGRMAESGSVRVSELFRVETYPTLHQMTSCVKARLKPGTGTAALLQAIFPPGSITGTPKIRAMEIISELETAPRGIYTGAIGMLAPNGDAVFNVAIRTVTLRDNRAEIGIGSGVVYDSDAGREYAECLLKMKFLDQQDFGVFETLLYDADKGFFLLEEHLSRLAASAAFFDFAFNREKAEAALQNAVRGQEKQVLRVKLQLARGGALEAAAMPFVKQDKALSFILSSRRVQCADALLAHKTTRRAFFEEELRRAREEHGADEVLFLNERGELTQGSFTNLFIQHRGSETLLTPPSQSGLLPGTLRAHLLKTGKAAEAVLFEKNIASAEAVYLGNSLRSLIKAVPAGVIERKSAA